MQRIALFGMFGTGNLGNDATLAVALHHIRLRAPGSRILVICGNPEAVARDFGVDAVFAEPRPPVTIHWRLRGGLRTMYGLAWLMAVDSGLRARAGEYLEGVSRLMIVGTGALDDFEAVPWGLPAVVRRWCVVARDRGIRVELLGVGAGPVKSGPAKWFVRHALNTAALRSFRDVESRSFAVRLGVPALHDPVIPDLVFGAPQSWLPAVHREMRRPQVVGVGVMAYRGWGDEPSQSEHRYRRYVARTAEFVGWLIGAGYEVRLLVGHTTSDAGAVDDIVSAVTAATGLGIGDRLRRSEISGFINLLDALAGVDVVVATRFHNVLSALMLGKPTIAVGYASKFEALMRSVDMPEYCQNVDDLNVDALRGQFRSIVAEHARISASLAPKVARFRAAVESYFDTCFPGT